MILVTGGSGFVGRHLIRHCVEQGWAVRVLTRNPARADLPTDIERIAGDITDRDSLAQALDGVDTVIHLAGRMAERADTQGLMRVNVEGTENLVRAARAAAVRRLVHVSSAGVYGDGATPAPHRESDPPRPGTPYERSKLLGEERVTASLADTATRWVILRPAGVYGPGRGETRTFFQEVARRSVWLFGPAAITVHPTHVRDVIHAVDRVLVRDHFAGDVINVAGERALDYRELLVAVGEALGHTPRVVSLPRIVSPALTVLRTGVRATGRDVPPSFRPGGVHRSLDTTKARTALGFEPVPLRVGLAEVAAWFAA